MIRSIVTAVAMALAPGLSQAPAAVAPAPAPAIPSADLATVAARGAALYAYDQAAWHTTDAMQQAGLPPETLKAIRGWVVEPQGAALRVTYYGLTSGKPYAIYVADYAAGRVSNGHAPSADAPRDLSPLGQRMAAARTLAFAHVYPMCVAKPFNTVILPPDARGVMPVYLLTPMTETGVYPFGGHHEIDLGPDGTIVGTRDFTKSCLPMKQPAGGKGKPVGLFVSHLLDPHPTELHVYLSLWSATPVFVGTGKQVWEVAGTKIRPISLAK